MTAAPETIVAVATAPGRGGVGIVRLSGSQAAEIARQIFVPKTPPPLPWPSHEMFYGVVRDENGKELDDGLAVRMAAPNSYTGEEVVEIQTHGSPVVLSEIVSLALAHGARLAGPGEFTRRAFLNGKIDLVQAEAVAEMIHAQSEAEAESARRRLDGRLSEVVETLREKTIALLATLEASVDFPEEELPEEKKTKITTKTEQIQTLARRLRSTYDSNRRLQDGFSVAIVGRPNVGKSSLFNALLSSDRAIVTAQPGTTRDVLREELILSGRRVRLIDTAGLRTKTGDAIEKIGIERATTESERADLVLLVFAADEGLTPEDQQFLSKLPTNKLWRVANKIDRRHTGSAGTRNSSDHAVSALRGDGIKELREAIGTAAREASEVIAEGGIANDRQRELLDTVLAAVEKGKKEWKKGASPEFVAFEFRQAYRAASRIIGKEEGIETILDEIFSRFCIGK
ncbi:MAG: tRNA uridine-5-carboxymethylaminomethyl(34) synthesis GTPase MnmE [Pseudomonadota bacterium]